MKDVTNQINATSEVELYEIDEIGKPVKQFVFIRQICEDLQLQCSTVALFDDAIKNTRPLPFTRKTEMRI